MVKICNIKDISSNLEMSKCLCDNIVPMLEPDKFLIIHSEFMYYEITIKGYTNSKVNLDWVNPERIMPMSNFDSDKIHGITDIIILDYASIYKKEMDEFLKLEQIKNCNVIGISFYSDKTLTEVGYHMTNAITKNMNKNQIVTSTSLLCNYPIYFCETFFDSIIFGYDSIYKAFKTIPEFLEFLKI
jgi:hypothetical protein